MVFYTPFDNLSSHLTLTSLSMSERERERERGGGGEGGVSQAEKNKLNPNERQYSIVNQNFKVDIVALRGAVRDFYNLTMP